MRVPLQAIQEHFRASILAIFAFSSAQKGFGILSIILLRLYFGRNGHFLCAACLYLSLNQLPALLSADYTSFTAKSVRRLAFYLSQIHLPASLSTDYTSFTAKSVRTAAFYHSQNLSQASLSTDYTLFTAKSVRRAAFWHFQHHSQALCTLIFHHFPLKILKSVLGR